VNPRAFTLDGVADARDTWDGDAQFATGTSRRGCFADARSRVVRRPTRRPPFGQCALARRAVRCPLGCPLTVARRVAAPVAMAQQLHRLASSAYMVPPAALHCRSTVSSQRQERGLLCFDTTARQGRETPRRIPSAGLCSSRAHCCGAI